MSKAHILQPDLVLGGVVTHLGPALIKEHNLQGLILDVDETLLPRQEKNLSAEMVDWVKEVRQYADLWLVSNNISKSRISSIASTLDLPYMFGAAKPSRRKLKLAAEKMNHPLPQIAMVGDRLFTDVLAGNRLGLFTVLVEPMMSLEQHPILSLRNFEVWISQKMGVTIYKSSK